MQIDRLKENLTELKQFFRSLDYEKKLADFDVNLVMKSEYFTMERVNGEIAGVAGLWKETKYVSALFLVVKKNHQGKKIGNKLMENLTNYAMRHKNFITLKTYDDKRYSAAIHLYKKYGFKCKFKHNDKIWMYLPFNFRGKLCCMLLKMQNYVYYNSYIAYKFLFNTNK